MIGFTLSFLTGIVTVQQLSTLLDLQWLMLSFLPVVIFLWLRFWYGMFFIFGLLWAILFATMELADRLPKQLESINIPVKGYISDLPKQNEKFSRFNFIVTEAPERLPRIIKLSWYFPDQPIKAAQQWSFTVKLKRPHGTLNPGGFDYERWLFEEGVGATGYILTYPRPTLLDSKPA